MKTEKTEYYQFKAKDFIPLYGFIKYTIKNMRNEFKEMRVRDISFLCYQAVVSSAVLSYLVAGLEALSKK